MQRYCFQLLVQSAQEHLQLVVCYVQRLIAAAANIQHKRSDTISYAGEVTVTCKINPAVMVCCVQRPHAVQAAGVTAATKPMYQHVGNCVTQLLLEAATVILIA
jgi:hypothetical protein